MLQQSFNKFKQHIDLRRSLQTAYGIRGQFVFNAGCLLWVKEEAMIKQQTQASA